MDLPVSYEDKNPVNIESKYDGYSKVHDGNTISTRLQPNHGRTTQEGNTRTKRLLHDVVLKPILGFYQRRATWQLFGTFVLWAMIYPVKFIFDCLVNCLLYKSNFLSIKHYHSKKSLQNNKTLEVFLHQYQRLLFSREVSVIRPPKFTFVKRKSDKKKILTKI